jgi:RecB family endonuclease NucS
LNSYIKFIRETESLDDLETGGETIQDPIEATGTVFRIEREMQAAVRRQLTVLEPGLREADGGLEFTVGTGRLDILAEDAQGQLVVIELKAGICPPGALEQTLGYAEALSKERDRPVRAFLVAAEFSDRVRAAAKRTLELELRTYEFSLRFHEVS